MTETEIDPNEVVPEGTPPELVSALEAIERFERAIPALRATIEERESALVEIVAREERCAFLVENGAVDSEQHYADAVNQRRDAEADLARAHAALRGARRQLHAARVNHHRLNHSKTVARFTRLVNHRAKLAGELQAAGEAYGKALTAFEAITVKLSHAFSATGARIFNCHLITNEAFAEVIPFLRKPALDVGAQRGREQVLGLKGNLTEMVDESNKVILDTVSAEPKFDEDDQ